MPSAADTTVSALSGPAGVGVRSSAGNCLRQVAPAVLWLSAIGLVLLFDQRLEALWDSLADGSQFAYYLAFILANVVAIEVLTPALFLLKMLDRRLPWRFIKDAAWVMFSQMFASTAAKCLFGRLRPNECGEATVFQGPVLSANLSFPSGHATAAFALAALLSAYYPRWKWVFVVLAVTPGLARVQFDRHFPSDILAGGVLGWYWARMVLAWLRRPQPASALSLGTEEPDAA